MIRLNMRKEEGLARVDLVVALVCIVLILAQAGIINAGGRALAKRELCLANLKTLTAAWQSYAADNAGNLVNGAASTWPAPCPAGMGCPSGTNCAASIPPVTDTPWYIMHKDELPWIGNGYIATPSGFVPAAECCQRCAIQTGALWKYSGDYSIYQCPVGEKDALVTYSIIDSMNGKYKWNRNGGSDNSPEMMAKNLSIIKNASKRIVFLDVQRLMPDSYAVYSGTERWFDVPPVTHENGVCVSFADGHSIFHKWNSQETIDTAGKGLYAYYPTTCDGKNDLYWMQLGCWGQLLYAPTCPLNP